jgi:hypothetical protein
VHWAARCSISAISAPIAAEALKKGDFEMVNALYKKVSLHQLLIGGLIFILLWTNIDNILPFCRMDCVEKVKGLFGK